jgi:hypothetical protein
VDGFVVVCVELGKKKSWGKKGKKLTERREKMVIVKQLIFK